MVRLRVRIRFSKQGDLRLIGHRDLMRCLERLFRRAGLALSFSEGFHPKPRMTFPLALAVGIEGVDEVMEVELAERYDGGGVAAAFGAAGPAGARVPRDRSPARGRQEGPSPKRVLRGPDPRAVPRPAWASGSSVCWPPRRGRSSVRHGARRSTCARSCWSWRSARACCGCGCAWTATAASARATCWPPSDWADLEQQGVRLRRTAVEICCTRRTCPQRMRTGRYCRTRKLQHETGNADQRRAAGGMPDRDR